MPFDKMEPHEEHSGHDPNNYVDLVSESRDAITQQTIFHIGYTQSQKKRRRFIPFKYHSKIFKASKKVSKKKHVDDHRISTSSSSYASCRTFKKDSGKSNVSTHTYQDIEECIHHAELARCNSIASESTISREAHKMTDEQGIPKALSSDSPMSRNTQIHYKMEFPKKRSRQAKKYMLIFCLILVCATISAVIASVSFRENIPSDVEKQLSHVDLLVQNLSNATNEEVKHHSDLRNEVHNFAKETNITNMNHFESLPSKRDMEELSNKTDMNTKLLLQILQSKADMEELLKKTKKIELLLQTLQNKADIEELSNKTKKIELLLQTLPKKSDFDVLKEENGISLRIIHAMRCKTECLKDMVGDYQSCFTCENFITCNNGTLVHQRCAPTGSGPKVYWDDFEKQCIFKSHTCDPSYTFH